MFLSAAGRGSVLELLAEGVQRMAAASCSAGRSRPWRLAPPAYGVRTDETWPRQLVWTAPLTTLNRLAGIPDVDLDTSRRSSTSGRKPSLVTVDLLRRRRSSPASPREAFCRPPRRPARAACASSSPAARDERWLLRPTRHERRRPRPVRAPRFGGRRQHPRRARAQHVSDLQVELPVGAHRNLKILSRTRICSPGGAGGSGITTWTTRSDRA